MTTANRTLSVHQEHELLTRLERAGLGDQLAQLVIGSSGNELAKWLVSQLRDRVGSAFLFPTLTEQLEQIYQWNRDLDLGLHQEDFDVVDLAPAGEQSLERADLLVPIFCGTEISQGQEYSFDLLWRLASGQQTNCWREPMVIADMDHLSLCHGAQTYVRGIHRVEINLLALWDTRGRTMEEAHQTSLDEGWRFAGIEVMAAAALFPKWVAAINLETVPFVDLPGFLLGGDALFLTFDGKIKLSFTSTTTVHHDASAPIVRTWDPSNVRISRSGARMRLDGVD